MRRSKKIFSFALIISKTSRGTATFKMVYDRVASASPRRNTPCESAKALKVMGYDTHTVSRDGRTYILPGEARQAARELKPKKHDDRGEMTTCVGKGVSMEVKINREIRNYTESMFFGLSLRQLIFSALAVAVAVGLYFLMKPYVGTETVSWVCVLGAAPFAALGFFTYHGMAAEQFIWAWLRSEVLEPRELHFEASTLYYDLLKPSIDKREKEEYKHHD